MNYWFNTDHWMWIVLMVGILLVGATVTAHILAGIASTILSVVMSEPGDRDEELVASGGED